MIARLGSVIYWIACLGAGMALYYGAFALVIVYDYETSEPGMYGICALGSLGTAVAIFLMGHAARQRLQSARKNMRT